MLFDLYPAFHTGDHGILIDRLENWVGVTGTALDISHFTFCFNCKLCVLEKLMWSLKDPFLGFYCFPLLLPPGQVQYFLPVSCWWASDLPGHKSIWPWLSLTHNLSFSLSAPSMFLISVVYCFFVVCEAILTFLNHYQQDRPIISLWGDRGCIQATVI